MIKFLFTVAMLLLVSGDLSSQPQPSEIDGRELEGLVSHIEKDQVLAEFGKGFLAGVSQARGLWKCIPVGHGVRGIAKDLREFFSSSPDLQAKLPEMSAVSLIDSVLRRKYGPCGG